ncbi:MAG: AzlC family ABC transporter permease, partial [Nocardioides sp.]
DASGSWPAPTQAPPPMSTTAQASATTGGARPRIAQRLVPDPHVRAGVRAMAPVAVAYVPFGLLVGTSVAASDHPLAAWLATWTVYGGAAHLAVLDVLGHGSGWVAAGAVGVLVNARLAAYSTAMAPQWRTASLRTRLLAGLLLTDAPWALARSRTSGQRSYYLGAAGLLWLVWPALVTLGALGGGRFGALPVLGLLSAMTLGSVVVTQLRRRPVAAAAGAAALTAVPASALPAGAALGLAALVGTLAGALATDPGRTRRRGAS